MNFNLLPGIQAVEELLLAGADPNQQLAPDVLSALCTIVNTKYEHRRTRSGRLALVSNVTTYIIISQATIEFLALFAIYCTCYTLSVYCFVD